MLWVEWWCIAKRAQRLTCDRRHSVEMPCMKAMSSINRHAARHSRSGIMTRRRRGGCEDCTCLTSGYHCGSKQGRTSQKVHQYDCHLPTIKAYLEEHETDAGGQVANQQASATASLVCRPGADSLTRACCGAIVRCPEKQVKCNHAYSTA